MNPKFCICRQLPSHWATSEPYKDSPKVPLTINKIQPTELTFEKPGIKEQGKWFPEKTKGSFHSDHWTSKKKRAGCQHVGSRSRQISRSLRPVRLTEWAPSQQVKHSETLPQNKHKKKKWLMELSEVKLVKYPAAKYALWLDDINGKWNLRK